MLRWSWLSDQASSGGILQSVRGKCARTHRVSSMAPPETAVWGFRHLDLRDLAMLGGRLSRTGQGAKGCTDHGTPWTNSAFTLSDMESHIKERWGGESGGDTGKDGIGGSGRSRESGQILHIF